MKDNNHQHKCEGLLSFTSSEAVKIKIEQDNCVWFLFYETYATDYDVKCGEAESIGEKLGEISIAIQYCPFCGHSLSKDRDLCS